MCGIFGLISKNFSLDDTQIDNILGLLNHRGPDDRSFVRYENLTFLHTRLSIQDLSSKASQPMVSEKGDTLIVFNGEIYNHFYIRKLLNEQNPKIIWKTSSDTETLLKSIDILGTKKTLNLIEGMFAFGYWDKKLKKLTLAVDRFSEKPLYYGKLNNNVFFTSDLSTVRNLNFIDKTVSKTGLSNLIRNNYIPHPHSIYKNIYKLIPGSYKEIYFDTNYKIKNIRNERYWNINEEYINQSIKYDDLKIKVEEFEILLKNVIKSQLISDVPVGCFLSGGLDSSLIAYLMNSVSKNEKINTFSIGFENKEYDESYYSNIVSKKINSNHFLKIFNDKDLVDIVPRLSSVYTEPFADSSQLPTALLSSFASSQNIKVVLTGDGGDELFGGYMRYHWSKKVHDLNFPKLITKTIKKIFLLFPEHTLDEIFYILRFITPKKFHINSLASKIKKVLDMMSINDIDKIYEVMTTNSDYEKMLSFDSSYLKNDIKFYFYNNLFNMLTCSEKMMLFDLNKYLPGDILPKVDRASMYSSLETRAPFLNQKIAKFAISLDKSLKLYEGEGKILLKKLMSKYFDNNFLQRPKKGFGIPLAKFLRNELKVFVQETIDKSEKSGNEYINLFYLKKKIQEHSKGADHKELIWSTLSFLSWHNQKIK